jgi:hypothetical protein
MIFTVYMKTDWGISLFFLAPLALVAIPSLRLQRTALFHITAIWLVITLAVLAASPTIAAREIAENPNGASGYGARSELARELTQAWQTRFHSRWAVVAGTTEVGEPMTSGAVHTRRALVVRVNVARGSQAARVHRYLRYVGCSSTGLRCLDGGQRSKRRAPRHHHAALLPRTSRSGDQLEGLYRAAGEIGVVGFLSPLAGERAHYRCGDGSAPGLQPLTRFLR